MPKKSRCTISCNCAIMLAADAAKHKIRTKGDTLCAAQQTR
jgi:hypothetical protein